MTLEKAILPRVRSELAFSGAESLYQVTVALGAASGALHSKKAIFPAGRVRLRGWVVSCPSTAERGWNFDKLEEEYLPGNEVEF